MLDVSAHITLTCLSFRSSDPDLNLARGGSNCWCEPGLEALNDPARKDHATWDLVPKFWQVLLRKCDLHLLINDVTSPYGFAQLDETSQ